MKTTQSVSALRWGVVAAFVVTILVNYLSQALLFSGKSIGEVSDKYSTLITPAGYAFSIWGLIYITLGIYVYHQAFRADPEQSVYDSIALPLVLNLLANSLWVIAFQFEFIALSAVLMLVILATLIQISIVWVNDRTLPRSRKARLRIPFSLYLGWISVATIVNLSVVVKYTGWETLGLGEPTWVAIMTGVGAGLALFVMIATRDIIFSLVIIWAYVAIAVAQNDNSIIFIAALGWAAVLLVAGIFYGFRQSQAQKTLA